jgi:hypothetical protein
MRDFFWHLEGEMHGRAFGKGQIRCKVYASFRDIQRLRCVLWRGRLCDADAKRNFEAESFGKASFGSSHGNDILPFLIREPLNPIDIPVGESTPREIPPKGMGWRESNSRPVQLEVYTLRNAVVAELADAMALGAIGRKAVEVRVLSTAPT